MDHAEGLLPQQSQMGYQNTLMYGHYTEKLGDFAKEEARRIKNIQKAREHEIQNAKQENDKQQNNSNKGSSCWSHVFNTLGEDWIFLGLLGIIMAVISFFLDHAVRSLYHGYILSLEQGSSCWSHVFNTLGEDWIFLGLLGIIMAVISFFLDHAVRSLYHGYILSLEQGSSCWSHVFNTLGEDWIFLGLLGIIMAVISFFLDHAVRSLYHGYILSLEQGSSCWSHVFNTLGEDWIFLGLLGIIMAVISFFLDHAVRSLYHGYILSLEQGSSCWSHVFNTLGEDWIFLGLLGIIMAVISFFLDHAVRSLYHGYILSLEQGSSCWSHVFNTLGEDWIFLGLLGIIMAVISFFLDHAVRSLYHGYILSLEQGSSCWSHVFNTLGEDWIFLGLLGIIMAVISFFLDHAVRSLYHARIWLYQDITSTPLLQYLLWILLPVLLILFAAGFVQIVSPQATGSGVPEVKTILRGVELEEFFTLKTLIAKVIGLIATLGSGIPLGKEAPFVHVASIIASQLSKLSSSFHGVYENQSRKTDMLAAACAVGLASCFASPIGGLLYSIEVTSVYFAVRNYSRGFFAAVTCVVVFRLFAVWFEDEETLTALYETNFKAHVPFDIQELIVFASMGVICGLGGAAYVWLHRQYVFAMRRNTYLTSSLQKNRFLYPGIVALAFASVSFPLGLGQFMAAELDTHHQILDLFTNFTWTKEELSVEEAHVLRHWMTPHSDVFVSLAGFVVYTFIFSIIGATVAIPSGNFIPVFKLGAGLGRLVGELMHCWFPNGMSLTGLVIPIIPGGYATVGAAAFTGAVTHSISVAVIVVEMTGQLTHLMPIIIAVLISNAIAALLQPSLYESMILIKKLPYLPVLLPFSSGLYSVCVEAFMVRNVKYIWYNMSYETLVKILMQSRSLKGFPLVDNPDSMILLGSIQRFELIRLIERQVGRERRLKVAVRWHREDEQFGREELERQVWVELQQKYSPAARFESLPVAGYSPHSRGISNASLGLRQIDSAPSFMPTQANVHPTKSILKNPGTGSNESSPVLLPRAASSTHPVSGNENRMRLVFNSVFRKSAAASLPDMHSDPDVGKLMEELSSSPTPGARPSKKVTLPEEQLIDMTAEEQRQWEDEELKKNVNFERCPVDPAPFQLVEKTSLMKCHSLFSLLGVSHAYVTAIGRLIGVVGLQELRKAIEESNSGGLPSTAEAAREEDGLESEGGLHSVRDQGSTSREDADDFTREVDGDKDRNIQNGA